MEPAGPKVSFVPGCLPGHRRDSHAQRGLPHHHPCSRLRRGQAGGRFL